MSDKSRFSESPDGTKLYRYQTKRPSGLMYTIRASQPLLVQIRCIRHDLGTGVFMKYCNIRDRTADPRRSSTLLDWVGSSTTRVTFFSHLYSIRLIEILRVLELGRLRDVIKFVSLKVIVTQLVICPGSPQGPFSGRCARCYLCERPPWWKQTRFPGAIKDLTWLLRLVQQSK